MSNIILSSKIVNEFALKAFSFLCKLDNLAGFKKIFSIKHEKILDAICLKDKESSICFPMLFISCDDAEFERRNNSQKRWFSDKIKINNTDYYLTNQWTSIEKGKNNRKNQYSIPKFKVLLEKYYPTYTIQVNNEEFCLIRKDKEQEISKKIDSNEFSINKITEYIKSTGLLYDDTLIKRYIAALLTKPFVILSGLAGSGKTKLSLAFAHAMCNNLDEQLCFIAVGADWTNREPLLGYPNALKTSEYVKPENGTLDFIIRASKEENKNKPYFLVLDEMNISYVERYFADFLSAMESNHPIALWNTSNTDVPNSIKLPNNLFIIGTINVDETTYMFSPKVLDRASVIEFKVTSSNMEKYLDNATAINLDEINKKGANMAEDFLRRSNITAVKKNNEIKKVLIEFFNTLKDVNAEFGYRSAFEIYCYINQAIGIEMDLNDAIDSAIIQKILPKLHGSRKRMITVLDQLEKLCINYNYKLSLDKIIRMRKAANENGYTSFAEA